MSPVLIALFALVAYLIYKRRRFIDRVHNIPSVFPKVSIGLIGQVLFITTTQKAPGEDMTGVTMRIVDGARTLFGHHPSGLGLFWVGPFPFVFTLSPESSEVILSSNTNIKKSDIYDILHSWLGLGLLTSWGQKWRNHRKLLTPAFHFKILEQFVPVINSTGRTLVNVLKKESKGNPDGIVEDIRGIILRCALDIICETAMGEKINALDNPDSKYIHAVETVGNSMVERTWKPWLHKDFVFNLTKDGREVSAALTVLHDFTDSVIRARKKTLTSAGSAGQSEINQNDEFSSKIREPFMDTLIHEHLRNPEQLTEKEIREEVDTFMFEGHDTTAWGMIWTTYLLGLHPDYQERVQSEVDSVFESLEVPNQLTLDDMNKLRFTEACIKEAQRLFPSVPVYGRRIVEDVMINGYVVPAGCQVFVCARAVHRDPNHWPQPERFNPDRFMSEEKRHPYAYIPFSAGARNCIGQRFALLEEKAIIATIFHNFKVTSLDHRDKVNATVTPICKTNYPIRVKLHERNVQTRL